MVEIVETVNRWGCGIPALILLSFTGLIFSVRTSWAQIRYLPCAIRAFLAPFYKLKSKSDTSRFQAVCTALAATVGTGNLVGVAGAISIGGPGAIFWMRAHLRQPTYQSPSPHRKCIRYIRAQSAYLSLF